MDNQKSIRERVVALSWFAVPMLVFGLLALLVLLGNSSEFENYRLPRSYQVIAGAASLLWAAGAGTLLITKNVILAKRLAIVLLASFVIGALETAYIVFTNFTTASDPTVAVALAVYFLGSMYFAFSTWSFSHVLSELAE